MDKLQRKYAAASRTLAAQSRMLGHLREVVTQREADHANSQARTTRWEPLLALLLNVALS